MAIIAVLIYFAVIVGTSLVLSRRNRSNSDFFSGGNRSPWPVVAIAMIGTSISGVTFVSVPGMVAASEFSYLQMALGFISGYVVIAYVLLPLFYRKRTNSLYCWLEERFGLWTYRSGAVFFLLSKLLGCGVKMYLTAIVLQLVLFDPLGVPFWLNVAVTVLLVWIYTFRGGVKTLVWTDMMQTLCMIGAVVLSIFYIGREMGLDFGGICSTVKDSGMTRIWFFDDARDPRFFWKQFLAGMFTTIAMTGLDQDMMQKNLSCRSLPESRKNVLSYGASFVPVNFLFLCLGVLLFTFAASRGLTVAKPDDLFPTIACGVSQEGARFMPPVVSLLFVLGLVSAAFSSSGSSLTSMTTSVTVDLLRADRRLDERRLRRVRMVVHACVAVVLALVILSFRSIGSQSVINAVYTVASYTYGPLLGLFAFGIFTRRRLRDKAAPLVCVASPLICLLLATHSSDWFGGYRIGFELLIYNALLSFLGFLAFSRKGK